MTAVTSNNTVKTLSIDDNEVLALPTKKRNASFVGVKDTIPERPAALAMLYVSNAKKRDILPSAAEANLLHQ